MNPRPSLTRDGEDSPSQALWEDGERSFCRLWRDGPDGAPRAFIGVLPGAKPAARDGARRLSHEYALREELDSAWALRPLDLLREHGRPMLVLEDHEGQPLEHLVGEPMELARFLRIAVGLAAALARLHERGLVHKDIKPAHVLVDTAGGVRLTGFGIASRLPRERQDLEPPEVIAGTLAYMAPEQTGRMNRSIDSRSDLYAFGVTLYQMLTGQLPFRASDPMEMVHCHIASRPVPPAERVPVPAAVSAIVMKLLAKTAEDRYQTAAGAAADLRRCLEMHEATGTVETFPLGSHDIPDVLRIPEKLYGREREVAALVAAFERVATHGTTELVLVSGYSGVGKSSTVHELHKAIVPAHGLFASGKFEQYRRDVPYATLAQAFERVVHHLLAASEAEVARWRQALAEALGDHGELMVRIIPGLELLLGQQAPVPDLPPREAQRRFQRVFRRLIGAFAQQEHPLVLFLDDLQWLDTATLTLLVDLASEKEMHHLLLVGAYRDNEVGPSHPLMRSLEAIRGAGASVSEIVLAPLALHEVGALISDALHCDTAHAWPLAELVQEKTAGNPFFAIQFLGALAEEKLLAYDACAGAWSADLERIHAKAYTDNVVDLMVGKLARLPADTREGLKQLACLGSTAASRTLSRLFGQSVEEVHASLWHAVRDGILLQREGSYSFLHDRLQEAAYSLVPEQSRAEVHLHIGRTLLAGMHPDEVIDVADQMNRGAALLSDPDERVRVADLNLRAGRKAKASTAYASASAYFASGMALLAAEDWSRHYELTFGLWLERAECEYLCGNGDRVEALVVQLLAHGASRVDKAAAYRLRIDLHVMRSEYPEAVGTALECLRLFGIDMPAHPTREQVDAEYEKVWRNLGDRPIESLLDLPRMTDPDMQAAMDVLAVLNSPAYFTDASLVRLHLCHMVNLTLAYGMSDASPHALALLGRRYAWFDLPAGWRVSRYTDAYRFATLARDLVEKLGVAASRAKVQLSMALTAVWTQPVTTAVEAIRSTHLAAVEGGDLTIGCYSCHHTIVDLMLRQDPLDEVWRETERGLDFVRKARFRDVVDVIVAHQRFILNMRGRTASFSTFGDAAFDEAEFEAGLEGASMVMMACLYWNLKQQARFLSGDYEAAREAGRKAEPLLWSVAGHIQLLDHCFYGALVTCATWQALPPGARQEARERLAAQLRQLSGWAEKGSVTFQDRYALLQAEAARIEGRELDAERSYEEAIRLAREHRFVQDEALANELAARFYAARGFGEIATLYLRNARRCYLRWGAEGKVRQLDETFPDLREDERSAAPMGTIGTPVEHLDLATVIKVSQAVSREIVLEKMLDIFMRTAIEQAGAERGVLLLTSGGEHRIAARVTTAGDTVAVHVGNEPAGEAALPQSVLQYVLRTQESLLLDDALARAPFSADPYIVQHRSRSILCLPLLNQAKLIGVLYVENSLAPRVFAPARIAVLKLLASEAAVSLENARLYRDVAEREAKIRRLVDSNIIGIFVWDLDGRILEANDAFLRILGYDREDIAAHPLRWTDLTPPEWVDRTLAQVSQLRQTGSLQPFEKEYFRKDGSRVPVLIGSARFEEGGTRGVAFVLDQSERKRSEAQARERERESRLIVDTIPGLVASFTAAGELEAVNRQLVEYCGQALDGMSPWASNGIIHPDDLSGSLGAFLEAMTSGEPYGYEARIRRFDGVYRWFQVRGLPLRDSAGRIARWYALLSDIDDRKQAEETLNTLHTELAHVSRVTTLSTLTASIAHEVNQPLAGIITNAGTCLRMLDADPPNLDGARETARRTMRDGRRAADVIARLRALFSKKEPVLEPVDLNEATREVIALSLSDLQRNRVALAAELDDRLPRVMADRVQLQQVILNLIRNAAEAMAGIEDRPRHLVVRSGRESDDRVRLSIRDAGVGLTPEAMDKLFEAFYTTKGGGMGIGLSVSRSIIERHGGRLWAEPNEGPGATFAFSLPVAGAVPARDRPGGIQPRAH